MQSNYIIIEMWDYYVLTYILHVAMAYHGLWELLLVLKAAS